MQRFKNVLFVADPLENATSALQRATELANLQGASLTIVDVLRDVPPTLIEAGIVSDELRSAVLDERQSGIRALVDESGLGEDTEVKLLIGTPFVEIIRQVISGKHDLVIKPAQGQGVGSLFFGRTDMQLLRKCPCPVWIVKATGRKKKYERILAAVDPDPREPNAELNARILELSVSLADRDRADVHVVSAWEMWGELAIRSRGRQAKIDELLEGTRKANARWLEQLTEPYSKKTAKFHTRLVKGSASDVIPEVVADQKIDLIVMGTVGRVGIPGLFIGNTAERILSQVECSVLAVKPDGFESPVRV